ncbi:MAG: ATP-binding protein [Cytophagales bacterium]|nr:MAG: ATP-binding protein [Cytophagales bacterium]TAF61752.1 MAG: ATP-binding protein [Cytophagales bacterium]
MLDLQISEAFSQEMLWLEDIIQERLGAYFAQTAFALNLKEPRFKQESPLNEIIKQYKLNAEERLVLGLALAPHLKPQMLDIFFTKNPAFDRGFSEFGGVKGVQHSGFLPTAETAVFLLSGQNLQKRLEYLRLFTSESPLIRDRILDFDASLRGEPALAAPLRVSEDFLNLLLFGRPYQPDYSNVFPAKRLETGLNWNDLIVEPEVQETLQDIRAWVKHNKTMQELGLYDKVRRGYRALFYGPPGTGKTLAASLLGKVENLSVYRIDLSMIVSKYIGETEKNLASVFDKAENKNWILFFDEADALFGKRTSTKDSKDRHANQEVAYLLQRIEDFPGLVVLATNLKGNLDEAFSRRFQTMLFFPVPTPALRQTIWENAFNIKGFYNEPDIVWEDISKQYELTGGAITNVLRYCVLQALKSDRKRISKHDLLRAIRNEMYKDGKTTF